MEALLRHGDEAPKAHQFVSIRVAVQNAAKLSADELFGGVGHRAGGPGVGGRSDGRRGAHDA